MMEYQIICTILEETIYPFLKEVAMSRVVHFEIPADDPERGLISPETKVISYE